MASDAGAPPFGPAMNLAQQARQAGVQTREMGHQQEHGCAVHCAQMLHALEPDHALHARAHHLCFVANSVNFPVRCEPVTRHQA